MPTYGQFCPVSKAAELLDQRWMLLVVRELLSGSAHFNEIQRGVPKMSRTLLSQRLRSLVRAGLVERTDDGRYLPTQACKELLPVVEALGVWGTRWVPALGDEDMDPHLLLWDMHRRVDLAALPPGRTVVRLAFPDVDPAARRWWLVLTRDGTDVCDADPGYEVDVALECPLPTLVRVWRGDVSWEDAQRTHGLSLSGTESARRGLPRWLQRSVFADVPRQDDGAAVDVASGHGVAGVASGHGTA